MKNRPNAEPPFSTEKFFLDMLPPDTKPSVGNMKPIIFNFVRRWSHEIKNGTEPSDRYFFYMLLHVKTALVPSDSEPKARNIFGVPKMHIIPCIQFLWALFAHYKRNPGSSPLLWGYETFTGGWLRLNSELFRNHLLASYIMIDWKRFDKYAQFSVLRDLFILIRTYLDFDHGYIPTKDYPDTETDWSPEKSKRLERLWNWLVEAFFEMPVVLPTGQVFKRTTAGIPSGLYPTQFIDSLYNTLMLLTILSSLGVPITSDTTMKIMGDDSLIKIFTFVPPYLHDDFLAAMQFKATYYFGSIISMDKSKIKNNINGIEVLSYTNSYGLPRRSETQLLAQFYHTRARHPTPAKTMASAIGFAYASCGHDSQCYRTLEHVYEFYKGQGIEPDPAGIPLAFGDDPFSLTAQDISLDHFPTKMEIQEKLTAFTYESDSVKRFYPMNHFLDCF